MRPLNFTPDAIRTHSVRFPEPSLATGPEVGNADRCWNASAASCGDLPSWRT